MTDANWEHSNSVSVDGEWAQSCRPVFLATPCVEGGSGGPKLQCRVIRLRISLTRGAWVPLLLLCIRVCCDYLLCVICRGEAEGESAILPRSSDPDSLFLGSSECSFVWGQQQQPRLRSGWYRRISASPWLGGFDRNRIQTKELGSLLLGGMALNFDTHQIPLGVSGRAANCLPMCWPYASVLITRQNSQSALGRSWLVLPPYSLY